MKRIALRGLVGLGLGLGFAVLEFVVLWAAETVFHDHTVQPMRSFNLAFGILNAPAEWLGYVWLDVLHLPPHSELAWVVVPVVTMLMQWGLIGLAGGLWWGFKSASSASGGGSRVWPVLLGGAGVIVACGLLALVFGAVFFRPAQPGNSMTTSEPDLEPDLAPPDQGQVDEAFRTIEANPDDAEAHCRLGVALARRERLDEAMAHFRKALEIKPDYAEAHYRMGLALADKGRLEEAITSYRKALEIKPDYAEARKHLNQAMKTRQ